MEKDQQEFIQAFAAISGAQDQKTLESKIQELGEQGIAQLYQVYQQVKDKGEQGLQILKQAYNIEPLYFSTNPNAKDPTDFYKEFGYSKTYSIFNQIVNNIINNRSHGN